MPLMPVMARIPAIADALGEVPIFAALTEEDLNDPSRFAQMPDGWRPWRILYDPGHYQGHADSIRAWLVRRESTP